MKPFLRLILFISCLFSVIGLNSQNKWTNNYLTGENPFGESLVEYYDKGYLLAGRFGPNYPDYCWLIKTDANGNEIWQKVIGDGEHYIVLTADIDFNTQGDIFLTGSTSYYNENDYDPLIMKLNTCGEKVWCKVFYEPGINFSNKIVATSDGGCLAILRYMSTDLQFDRICLAKLNSTGELTWKQCYNSTDTLLRNEDAYDLTLSSDGGYLITGICDYQDINPPHYLWIKPYYIKTDSLGNFEWEKVLHSEGSAIGGSAWNSVLSPDSSSFYSSISHYYHTTPVGDAPALVKLSLDGELIDIYDLTPPGDYGKMISAKFVTDTTLAASAVWGNGDQSSRAVIIDTLGNIIEQTMVLDNDWMGQVEITFDQKILYFTNLNEGADFDAYLFKYNQNLESDSIYTQYFTYDSLCDGEIISDTIFQDDCGIIVGDREIWLPKDENENQLVIYPNPATHKFKVQSLPAGSAGLKFEVGGCVLRVFDLFGRRVEEVEIPKGQTEIEIDVTGWKKGLYVVRVNSKDGLIGSSKVLVE